VHPHLCYATRVASASKSYQCGACNAIEEDPFSKPDRLTKGMVLCRTCGGVMMPLQYDVVSSGSFAGALMTAFKYPFSSDHLGWILAVWLGAAVLRLIPLAGGIFALSVQITFFFAVVRSTYMRRDSELWESGDSPSDLYGPVFRGLFVLLVAWGPALLCALLLPSLPLLATVLALLGFVLFPAFLMAATVAGSTFMNPVGAALLVLRFPGPYALLLCFLVLPIGLEGVIFSALAKIDLPLFPGILQAIAGVLCLMIAGRMMGLFMREHKHLM
jgi:hypothetical protein